VSAVGLERANDESVWVHAIEQGYVIVSKDEDFHQMALVVGPPPKVVWVRLGNCSTEEIEQTIREGRDSIEAFVADDDAAFLVLGQ
jgi:predicted nuclease of predicted toxin-antitoxin system